MQYKITHGVSADQRSWRRAGRFEYMNGPGDELAVGRALDCDFQISDIKVSKDMGRFYVNGDADSMSAHYEHRGRNACTHCDSRGRPIKKLNKGDKTPLVDGEMILLAGQRYHALILTEEDLAVPDDAFADV